MAINGYYTVTDTTPDQIPVSTGFYTGMLGDTGGKTFDIAQGAGAEGLDAGTAAVIFADVASGDVTVARDGTTLVITDDASGEIIASIAAGTDETTTVQFSDGSTELAVADGTLTFGGLTFDDGQSVPGGDLDLGGGGDDVIHQLDGETDATGTDGVTDIFVLNIDSTSGDMVSTGTDVTINGFSISDGDMLRFDDANAVPPTTEEFFAEGTGIQSVPDGIDNQTFILFRPTAPDNFDPAPSTITLVGVSNLDSAGANQIDVANLTAVDGGAPIYELV